MMSEEHGFTIEELGALAHLPLVQGFAASSQKASQAPTDGASQKPSVPPMADLKKLKQRLDHKIMNWQGISEREVIFALLTLVECIEQAATQEAGTPTS